MCRSGTSAERDLHPACGRERTAPPRPLREGAPARARSRAHRPPCVRVATLRACVALPATHAAPLPALKIDATNVTVSGLSSGGYMATQLHVARSSLFRGAGVVAAGPYYCAQGIAALATTRCLTRDTAPPVDTLVATARQWAAAGLIDATSHLGGFEGLAVRRRQRHRARAGARRRSQALLRGLRAAGQHRDARRRAGRTRHADRRLRQRLRPPRPAVHQRLRRRRRRRAAAPPGRPAGAAQRRRAGGQLHRVRPARIRRRGLRAGAPRAGCSCRRAAPPARAACTWCCTAAARTSTRWATSTCCAPATTAGPTATASSCCTRRPATRRSTPAGTGGATPAPTTRRSLGPQIGAIVAMVERLAGTPAVCIEAMNGWHVWAGRARWDGFGAVVAKGSGQRLGWWWRTSSLRESPRGHFVEGRC